MAFDFSRWSACILGADPDTIRDDHLLEATGLIDIDYVDDDIAILMRDIEAELEEAHRRETDPDDPPAVPPRTGQGDDPLVGGRVVEISRQARAA